MPANCALVIKLLMGSLNHLIWMFAWSAIQQQTARHALMAMLRTVENAIKEYPTVWTAATNSFLLMAKLKYLARNAQTSTIEFLLPMDRRFTNVTCAVMGPQRIFLNPSDAEVLLIKTSLNLPRSWQQSNARMGISS